MTCRLEDSYTCLCVKGEFAFLASQSGVLRVELPTFAMEKVNSSEATALAVTEALDIACNFGKTVEVWRGKDKVWSGQEHDTLLARGS